VSNVLITGCSTGIGFATAISLAQAEHKVFAAMRNPSSSPELAARAADDHLPIRVLRMDVDSDESVREAVQEVLSAYGRIDVLVNNAGIAGGGPVEEVEIELFRKIMETNFFGALRCMQAVLPRMRQQNSGHIINVTSVAGRIAIAPQAAYAASKWALEATSEALAQEVRRFGIRVTIVEPGLIATPILGKVKPRQWSSHYPQMKRLRALFNASLQNPTPPSVVADKILHIVNSDGGTFRNPVGDANVYFAWRASMTDEQWIELNGVEDDEVWCASVKRHFGIDPQFT
jgi:NAD(P)-dependent dehydrogenase (short-subunit alcohol dehydrogenase family)